MGYIGPCFGFNLGSDGAAKRGLQDLLVACISLDQLEARLIRPIGFSSRLNHDVRCLSKLARSVTNGKTRSLEPRQVDRNSLHRSAVETGTSTQLE